jgi:hypothetical protein
MYAAWRLLYILHKSKSAYQPCENDLVALGGASIDPYKLVVKGTLQYRQRPTAILYLQVGIVKPVIR